ncbi:hypothetical protein ACFFGR_01060 [Arthrobacter liuii]|uniref:Glycosyltransferase RgtA/B/C/D-like domain-containing protein n=1 Tax=Arthrobacter liuii TaxID=1476996 RepID=A0ABQ2AU25_9MICC|nr:hypothetical protein [Arthrobacter liuii]GGH97680.1 hypothetical protein GCM10007170_28480 [Arthrobacter liuii]
MSPQILSKLKSLILPVWRWVSVSDRMARIVVIALYVLVVLTGATTSSIGVGELRQDPASPEGSQLGTSSLIRSDEYNAFSPIAISIMATGAAPTTSYLAAPADVVHRYPTGGFFETFVYFDSTMLRSAAIFPDEMVFAAHWWLPAVLLFLFLPKWFEQVGASRKMGWLAAFLIALSPAASWWTMMPIQLIAYTIAGSSLLLSAYSGFEARRWLGPIVQSVIGGILLAGVPSFYIPWSLVLGLPVLAATVLWILTRQEKWLPKIKALGFTAGVALIFGVGTLLENRAGINALLNTVYPGSRRSTGEAQPVGLLFGAPSLGELRDAIPVGSNQSEMSTAFTITFVWAMLIWIALSSVSRWRENVVALVLGVSGGVWLLWSIFNFGPVGTQIPLLNYVQPARAAQVSGIIGTLLVAVLLSRLPRTPRWRLPVAAALTTGAVTAYAGSQLQLTYLPTMSRKEILLAGLGVAVVVLIVTRFPRSVFAIGLGAVLAAIPVYGSNPLLFGLGDLRTSPTASYFYSQGKASRDAGTLWATDRSAVDTLLLANGVPSLTGVQRSGPDESKWAVLDPEQRFANDWNRGGGFIQFAWTPGAPKTFSNNGGDRTIVHIDPCDLKKAFPALTHITASGELAASCLRLEQELTWSGQKTLVYSVS